MLICSCSIQGSNKPAVHPASSLLQSFTAIKRLIICCIGYTSGFPSTPEIRPLEKFTALMNIPVLLKKAVRWKIRSPPCRGCGVGVKFFAKASMICESCEWRFAPCRMPLLGFDCCCRLLRVLNHLEMLTLPSKDNYVHDRDTACLIFTR